jgi:hypothetical protein
MSEILQQSYYLALCPSSNFLKKHNVLETCSVSVFKRNAKPAGPLILTYEYSQTLGTTETVTC